MLYLLAGIISLLFLVADQLTKWYIASNFTNGAWAAMTPENEEKTSWSIIGTGAQLTPGWGPIYGINTERAYNDSAYKADNGSKIISFDTDVAMLKVGNGGDGNVEISETLVDAEKQYKLIFTVLEGDAAKIKLVEAE